LTLSATEEKMSVCLARRSSCVTNISCWLSNSRRTVSVARLWRCSWLFCYSKETLILKGETWFSNRKRFPSTEENLLLRPYISMSSPDLHQQTDSVTRLPAEAVVEESSHSRTVQQIIHTKRIF
jgi:hypothetical protein